MLYLYETKIRFYYIVLFFIFTWSCSYFFFNQFIYLLTIPLKKVYLQHNPNAQFHLIFTEITEIFFSQTKLATYITIILLFPFILYQFWLFIKPGLYSFEKTQFCFICSFSLFLTWLSLFLTYFLLLPSACKFFLSFETITGFNIYLEAKMDKYLSFILNIFITSYLFFQLPIYFFFFFKIGLINQVILTKNRKFIYLLILFFSFLIIPSNLDFVNLFCFIFFLFFFYELSLFILFYYNQLNLWKKYKTFNQNHY